MLEVLGTGLGAILQLALILSSPFLIILVVMFFKNMDRRLENIENALGIKNGKDLERNDKNA